MGDWRPQRRKVHQSRLAHKSDPCRFRQHAASRHGVGIGSRKRWPWLRSIRIGRFYVSTNRRVCTAALLIMTYIELLIRTIADRSVICGIEGVGYR